MKEVVHADYKFGCPIGEWGAQLDGKKWGNASNIVLYFTRIDTGEKFWLSAF